MATNTVPLLPSSINSSSFTNPSKLKRKSSLSFLPLPHASQLTSAPLVLSPPQTLSTVTSPSLYKTSPVIPHASSSTPLQPHVHFFSILRLAIRHKNLFLFRAVHALLAKISDNSDHTIDVVVATNHLILGYISLGLLVDAQKVLDRMSEPNVISFSLLISAYANQESTSKHRNWHGGSFSSAGLFSRMRQLGIHPNSFALVALLTDCIRSPNPLLGYQVHGLAIKSCLNSSLHVSNALLRMYSKFDGIDIMLSLFDEMSERDTSSWNAVLLGLVEERRYQEAFDQFLEMKRSGISWDHYSLSTLLTAATEGLGVFHGKAIHAGALKSGLELDMVVSTSLLEFYRKYGSVDDMVDLFNKMPAKDITAWNAMLNGFMDHGLIDSAMEVFDKMPERDSITFNSLLTGFCKNGEGNQGLDLFVEMFTKRMPISDFSLIGCINAVAIIGDRKQSEQIHGFVVKCGCKLGPRIHSALIDMYVKCDRTENAHKLFEKWSHEEDFNFALNSVLSSYIRAGHPEKTLNHYISCFKEFEPSSFLFMDEFVVATVVGACAALGFEEMGQQMHCLAAKSRTVYADSDPTIANAIVSMYAKCGNLEHARKVFDQMVCRDEVSWNALMYGHLLHGQGDRVLDLWTEMKRLGLKPDALTLVLVISACRYTTSSSVSTSHEIFLSMKNLYNIEPTDEHYAAMVEVLGFWGYFDAIEKLISNAPFNPGALIWRSLLEICRLKPNPVLAKKAMQNLVALEPEDEATYILASNIYAASSRWYCSERVREEMRSKGMQKVPVSSWLIHNNTVHRFYTRDKTHPRSKDIYSGLDVLILECMKNGYEPDTSFVLHEVEEYQKKHFLFYHSAKLAVMYGILVTAQGDVVRVMKNVRLCGDCHSFMKLLSIYTGREILVRDTKGFHFFRNGVCSCRDSR
ncbi:Pentatricopeptide repeat-containing protein [Rhynchospora pubera]|uniref:Pentatricopeptide repeat-containing protein n=1 Tax=Rhynchospora pubera TaxID=906938 RepID=A0AAV8BRP6_9POAL|nr:Pentatricopeptide repeat-containing protein [Rhynchospora pubera]